MQNTEFLGYLLAFAVPLLASLIAIIRPIINLNTSITRLNDSIGHLNEISKDTKGRVDANEEKIADHETRISIIENRDK